MGLPYSYIAIEGNIGAGKTSLATMLSEEFNAKLVLEEFADNPFLPKFYDNADRYAFPLELSFLAERFAQLKKDLNSRDLFQPSVIADYFISKSKIFAKANLSKEEYALFNQVFELMDPSLPKPQLLVYLHLPVEELQKNIKKRGREYEQNIQDKYLQKIQKSYFSFIKQQRKLRTVVIDTSGVDFVNNPD
ncbi:MAG: deoxynucleoside kinase, partial [Flavobacteriales bacterium]|nr:deoxynucleoside kinase [Flavobacteriales bacterium]